MRRLVLPPGLSLDGYVASTDRSRPWGDEVQDLRLKQWILDSASGAGAHLMGRATYEAMSVGWPTSTHEYAPR